MEIDRFVYPNKQNPDSNNLPSTMKKRYRDNTREFYRALFAWMEYNPIQEMVKNEEEKDKLNDAIESWPL